MIGGDFTACRVDDPGGDGESAGCGGAGAGEIDLGEAVKVGLDAGRVAVCKDEPDGAGKVPRQLLDAVGLGFLRSGAKGARGEFGFAKEDAGEWNKLVLNSFAV